MPPQLCRTTCSVGPWPTWQPTKRTACYPSCSGTRGSFCSSRVQREASLGNTTLTQLCASLSCCFAGPTGPAPSSTSIPRCHRLSSPASLGTLLHVCGDQCQVCVRRLSPKEDSPIPAGEDSLGFESQKRRFLGILGNFPNHSLFLKHS